MNARETAQLLSVKEFTTICSWLDLVHGAAAKRINVISVLRNSDKSLQCVTVELMNKRCVEVTSAMVAEDCARLKREWSEKVHDTA